MNQIQFLSSVKLLSRTRWNSLLCSLAFFGSSYGAEETCNDMASIKAANTLAQSYFQQSKLFESGRVLKKHSPSRSKEVVSYVKVDERRYSIFTLVDTQCEAQFLKRTRQYD